MALTNILTKVVDKLLGKTSTSEVIDTTEIIDEQLNPEMLDELSNGKGEDE